MDFSIKAFFGGDTTNLRQSAAEAEGVIKGFGTKANSILGEVGSSFLRAFSVATLISKALSSVGEIQEHIRQLQIMSKEYGVSTDALQAFEAAVIRGGGTAEAATRVWDRMRLVMDQLASGTAGPLVEAFDKLGLSAQDFVGLSLDQQLENVAKGFEANKTEAGAFAALADIMGRKLLPQVNDALGDVAKGMGNLVAEQKKANKVWDEDAMRGLTTFVKEVKSAGQGILTLFVDAAGYVATGLALVGRAIGTTVAMVVNATEGLKTDVAGVKDAMESGLVKPVKDVTAAVTAQQEAFRGTKATAEELAAAVSKSSKSQLEDLLKNSTHREKITLLMREESELKKEMAKFDKDSKEFIEARAKLQANADAQKKAAMDQEKALRLSITDEEDRALLIAKKKQPLSEQEKQAARELAQWLATSSVTSTNLTNEEKRRLTVLELQTAVRQNQVETTELLNITGRKLTDEEKHRLLVLAYQTDQYEAQIEKINKIAKEAKNAAAVVTATASGDPEKIKFELTRQAKEAVADERSGKITTAEKDKIIQALNEQFTNVVGDLASTLSAYLNTGIHDIRGSNQFASASDEVLRDIIRRDQEKIFAIDQQLRQGEGVAGSVSAKFDRANLQLDADAAQKELDLRKGIRGVDYSTALRNYKGDPLNFDQLYNQINQGYKAQDKANETLSTIAGLLKTTFGPGR